MVKIKLTKNNFIKQITRYGYFAEQMPQCFNSDLLADKIDLLLPHINCDKNYANFCKRNNCTKQGITSPAILSTYKNDIARRVIYLPNPLSFLVFVKLLSENWNQIKQLSASENSLSPITYIHSYFNCDFEMLNSENVRESKKSRSDYINNVKDCIMASIGCKCRLKVDVANCYNSIYTHSISWAICGKENAKKYMRTKLPATLKADYELADLLDVFMRYQKNNETNGIVVGPFTSRIFSEIILASLDNKFREKGYKFSQVQNLV